MLASICIGLTHFTEVYPVQCLFQTVSFQLQCFHLYKRPLQSFLYLLLQVFTVHKGTYMGTCASADGFLNLCIFCEVSCCQRKQLAAPCELVAAYKVLHPPQNNRGRQRSGPCTMGGDSTITSREEKKMCKKEKVFYTLQVYLKIML